VLSGRIAPDYLGRDCAGKDQPYQQDAYANEVRPVRWRIGRAVIGFEAVPKEAADDEPWKFQKAHSDAPFTLESVRDHPGKREPCLSAEVIHIFMC
jgi:hypothetical protein